MLDELVSGEAYQKVDHRYLNGPAIDQVFADETGGNGVLWYLSDTQNTVRDVAKYASTTAGTQATVRNHLEYNTFGIVTTADDPTTVTVNDGDRPGLEGTGNEFSPQRSYTGREPDTATGLIYYRARWFDPRIGRFISEDPIGFAAGDANLSRYVGNSAPNAVDPSGLREPAPTRGSWESGDVNNGTFTYNKGPDNGPMAGNSLRFQDGKVAVGSFPYEAYLGGNAASASVSIDDVGPGYRKRAIAQMIKEGKVPADFNFKGYSAHHAGPSGSKVIEFVRTEYHGKVSHDGTAKDLGFRRSATGTACPDATTGGKLNGFGKKAVVHGLVVMDVIDTAITAFEYAGLRRKGTVLSEAVVFTDEHGDQFVVSSSTWRWLWLGTEIQYISGHAKGTHAMISESELEELRQIRDDMYGVMKWNRDKGEWTFTPGVRSPKSLPIYQELQPWEPGYSSHLPGGSGKQIGYVDENGEHYGFSGFCAGPQG